MYPWLFLVIILALLLSACKSEVGSDTLALCDKQGRAYLGVPYPSIEGGYLQATRIPNLDSHCQKETK